MEQNENKKYNKQHTKINETIKHVKYIAILQVILLIVIAYQLSSIGSAGITGGVVAEENAVPNQPTNPSPTVNMKSLIDDDAIKGNKNAPVTIVEFSDYECPFCAKFYSETLPQIQEKYIKTGKVKFVYKDLPLSFHANAQKAAEAAECAGEQDKYYEMHNILFERGVQGGVPSFKQYSQQIGLNTNKFNTCLDSGAMASEVAKDINDAQSVGIQGTPGFIINGQLISGAMPFATFDQAIQNALNS